MKKEQIDPLEKQVAENLNLSERQRKKFLREAHALRSNLTLRKNQQKNSKKDASSSQAQ